MCLGSGNPPPQPHHRRPFDSNNGDDLDDIDAAENGRAPAERRCDLDDGCNHVNPYLEMESMSDEDWDDLEDIRIILEFNKQQRSIKYRHDRKDWQKHVEMLVATKEFHNRFRMNRDEFEYLFDALEDAITVSFVKSMAKRFRLLIKHSIEF